MFIEIVDQLRCLRPHEDSWLIAATGQMVGRHVVEGSLGCHVCDARYIVHEGVVYMDVAPRRPGAGAAPEPADPELALKLAALLGLSEPGGFAVLAGDWGTSAATVAELAPVHLLLLNPPWEIGERVGASVLRTPGVLPLAAGSCRGVALDARADAATVDSAVRALRTRGRLVAPNTLAVPEGITELARDEAHWVGERQAAPSRLVSLGVARSP